MKIKRDKKTLKKYESDASKIHGHAVGVLIPATIKEICKAVSSNSNITPRGAGTGLSGGAVPENGLVIEMNKFNKILKFDKKEKTIAVQAGVVLDVLNKYLEKKGLEFPINPSSHAVCEIGGMIATNAVGSRAVKYGKTSDWIKWLEIVDKDGNLQKKTGKEIYDYAGLEGITGIIAKACLMLSEKKQRTANFMEIDTMKEVVELVKKLKMNSDVSMIEFFGKQVSEFSNLEKKYHLLIEYESEHGHLKEDEYKKILALRDRLYPTLVCRGCPKIEDPLVHLDAVEKLMKFLEKNEIPVFGHLGVGILHPCFSKEKEPLIDDMMKLVKKLHGKISGEHGIGLLKRKYLERFDKKIYLNVKKRLDPENKFNPGKIIQMRG